MQNVSLHCFPKAYQQHLNYENNNNNINPQRQHNNEYTLQNLKFQAKESDSWNPPLDKLIQ